MPSVLHEALRDLFTRRPELLEALLPARLEVRDAQWTAVATELTDPRMPQLLPDAVLVTPHPGAPELVLVVEVQLSVASAKRTSWPFYVAAAYARFACMVEVVVVTPSADVERWASRPIQMGGRSLVSPVAVGPSAIPMMTQREIRQSPPMGMLSTLANMSDPRCPQQALDTLAVLATEPQDADGRLADILFEALDAPIRYRMEELMQTGKYDYRSDFAKKYFARGREEGREEGRAAGRAASLLTMLRARGLIVSEAAARRIESEQDEARLDAWVRRALDVTDVEALLRDG